MAKYALQALGGWRNEPCLIQIRVVGLDLTGKALHAQVRLAPDTPGQALLDLAGTTDAAASGIRLVSVTFDAAGIPTSLLTWQATKPAMQGLPYSGELGTSTVLSYALQFDGQTRLYGPFVVLASSIDSDNAPANRPPAYALGSNGGGADGITLTIGNDGVSVVIDGAGQLSDILTRAQALLDVANRAVAASQASSRDSAGYAAGAATSAVAARLQADRATAANLAGQATIAQQAALITRAATDNVAARLAAANLLPTSGTAVGGETAITAPAGVPADKAAWVDVFANGALVSGFTTDGSRTIRLATALKAGDKWFVRQFQSVVGDSGAAPTLAGYAVVLSRGGQSVAAPLAVLRT